MAKIEERLMIQAEICIRLSEEEAAALDALAGYGAEAFLKVFYAHLGKSYLEPHEKGLRLLFDTIRGPMSDFYEKANQARLVFYGQRKAVRIEQPTAAQEAPHAK